MQRARRSALAATSLLAGLAVAGTDPAAAAADVTYRCGKSSGYECTGNLGYRGQSVWGSYGPGHNCTSWASYRMALTGMAQPWAPMGSGYQWDDNARANGVRVDRLPTVGSIAQWDGGSGHVAVVEVVDDRFIEVSEDNYAGYSSRRRIGRGSSTFAAAEFIHLRDPAPIRAWGDLDGDGDDTVVVVYRTAQGLQWHVRGTNGSGPADAVFTFGSPTDNPVVGDWDGDGRDGIGVVRRAKGSGLQWLLRNAATAGAPDATFLYGSPTDEAIVGDWDGDGRDGIGVTRAVRGQGLQWHLRDAASSGPAAPAFVYGLESDLPVAGDWDGARGDGIGVVRRAAGRDLEWHLRDQPSPGPARAPFGYGTSYDHPAVGDWDGVPGDGVGVARTLLDAGVQWHQRDQAGPGPASRPPFLYGSPDASSFTTV